jgi:hypothetical protein
MSVDEHKSRSNGHAPHGGAVAGHGLGGSAAESWEVPSLAKVPVPLPLHDGEQHPRAGEESHASL